MDKQASMEIEVIHEGGCQCGCIQFQIRAPSFVKAANCNCSVCFMKQNIHFMVPKDKFKLLKGKEKLSTYTFNTHRAKHLFCSVCGVQSFYTPRSHPDCYGINVFCVKPGTLTYEVFDFDGQNWERSMKKNELNDDFGI